MSADSELIAQCLRGDSASGTAAFGTLVLRYRKMVIGIAYRLCGDVALAEDIAQEAFIRVWEQLSSYRPGGNFRAWLARIATNLTIDALRRRKPTVDIAELSLVAPGQGPEATALADERAAAVRAALMRLPLPSRSVLVLREYEALSYREIADVLDVPLGTVKSRLNDARRRLKAELASYIEA